MNHEDITAIYEQVSVELCHGTEWCWHGVAEPLERFAALVAAAEREACAKIADAALGDNKVSDAIRARGEKP